MSESRTLLSPERLELTLKRLAHNLLEKHDDFHNSCVIGLQTSGVKLADRILPHLVDLTKGTIRYGKLDITFYRDDFRHRPDPIRADKMEMDFLVEGLRVVLVDDVLYTGRSTQAAMQALQHYGRPAEVEVLTLIDRRFNRHLPIKANYTGIQVDSVDEAYVKVLWEEENPPGRVLLFPSKDEVK